MPFNPQIPLGGQTPQAQSPFQTFSDMMRAKQSIDASRIQKQQERIGQIELEKVEQDKLDDDLFRDLTQKNLGKDGTPNWQAVSRSALAAGKFDVAQKAQTQHDNALKADDVRYTTSLNQLKQQVGLVRPLFQRAYEAYDPAKPETLAQAQAMWDVALKKSQDTFGRDEPGPNGQPMRKLPALIEGIPKQFSPDAAKQIVTFGLTMDEDIKLQNQAIAKLKEAADLREKGLSAEVKERESIGNLLATTKSQEDWDKALGLYANRNITPGVLESFGATFSPDAVNRAGRLAMGEKEWQVSRDRIADNNRQSFNDAETRKRNELNDAAKLAGDASGLDKWKTEKLMDIDRRLAGEFSYTGTSSKITPEQANNERKMVQDAYALGLTRLNQSQGKVGPPQASSVVPPPVAPPAQAPVAQPTAPPAGNAPPQRAAPSSPWAPQAAPAGRPQAAPPSPGSPPRTGAAAPTTGGVPPDVAKGMKDAKAGQMYAFGESGDLWEKDANGNITKATPQPPPPDVQAALKDVVPGRYKGHDGSEYIKYRNGVIMRVK